MDGSVLDGTVVVQGAIIVGRVISSTLVWMDGWFSAGWNRRSAGFHHRRTGHL